LHRKKLILREALTDFDGTEVLGRFIPEVDGTGFAEDAAVAVVTGVFAAAD